MRSLLLLALFGWVALTTATATPQNFLNKTVDNTDQALNAGNEAELDNEYYNYLNGDGEDYYDYGDYDGDDYDSEEYDSDNYDEDGDYDEDEYEYEEGDDEAENEEEKEADEDAEETDETAKNSNETQ